MPTLCACRFTCIILSFLVMKKRIVLCADDYGQAPHISQGICDLVQKKRLSATSCMVNSPYWQAHAAWLMPYQSQIDIGLHFNLTEGAPLSRAFKQRYGDTFLSLSTMLRRAFFRQLDQAALSAECHAQVDRFYEVMGFLPRFIDGHQHVHQFPIIRTALLEVYSKRLQSQAVYVRLVRGAPLSTSLKKMIIYNMGGKAFAQQLKLRHIPHNQTFSGIYSFKDLANDSTHYRALFQDFLAEIGDGGMIMCHPGLLSDHPLDAIASARYAEYCYFSGDDFLNDCESEEVVIERYAGGL